MNLNEFKIKVQRTMPDLGSLLLNSIHMTLGMGSELFDELICAMDKDDAVNVAEELVDLQWYLCNYATLYGIEVPEIKYEPFPANEVLNRCWTAVGKLQDYDKKELAYGKTVSLEERTESLMMAFTLTEALAGEAEIDMNVARERLIAKLMFRYPEGFDTEKAINRDTVTERRILEGGDA